MLLHQGEALLNCRGKAAKQTLVCTPEQQKELHSPAVYWG